MNHFKIALLAGLGLATAAAAVAKSPAPPSPLINAIDACRTIGDAAARLACFDRTSAALVGATKSGEVSVVDRGQLREARRSLFGFSMPKLPFFSGDDSADSVSDTLESTVKRSWGVGYGRFRVVIAEGNAEWETTESFANFREPRAGQKVSIKRGPLGSYLLKFDGQRGVKGKRVG